jgi:hypothetical protein
MKKFIVDCIQISILGNKVAKYGEEVNASQLAGDPKVLIEKGYIVKAKKSKKAAAEDDSSGKKELLDETQLLAMSKSDIFDYAESLAIVCRSPKEGTQKEMITDVLAHELLE